MWRKAADLVKLPTFFDCMNISEVTGAGGLVSELRPVEFIMQEKCDFKRWLRSAISSRPLALGICELNDRNTSDS